MGKIPIRATHFPTSKTDLVLVQLHLLSTGKYCQRYAAANVQCLSGNSHSPSSAKCIYRQALYTEVLLGRARVAFNLFLDRLDDCHPHQ